ncbi:MAG: phosphoribosylglycinamide formyltransferase [Planktotalea sp.]|uniref:phosphoribosylglycinamide formyltransferase n=1 Tax=Planktotalea sp. TaxID=2029877 RepID=UPI000183A2FB|nr:phosphoribosylglycinamide formyltransferase [Planktotalea sp.]EDZ44319.1 phosphoribosylglycinamide formyltransferase [Rhodobacteraceae bacterium HTCC2083]MDG1076449.1 phosphoribosylglycinamide formyltransferase [Planktotalea sp.]MDG1086086.1 phosphoribosylglycinamide formyltransferase [Planktotalea sp.]
MKPRVAVLISGGGSNMVKLLESMEGDHPAEPVLVLANSDSAGGLAKAQALGTQSDFVDHRLYGEDRAAFEDALIAKLDAVNADLICLAGFMRVLTSHFIERYDGLMLNIHPSLLPKYKGLHTHARALEAGDTEAGCTVHEVTAKLDDGPIIEQARVPILSNDTPDKLAARVLIEEHRIYPSALRRFVEAL